jgi:hypothetical protein
MGLFSSVLHVHDTSRERLLPAMDGVLRDAGFLRSEIVPLLAAGPYALANRDDAVSTGPYYLVSPQRGHWLTVIEAHFAVDHTPHLSELGNRLSAALSCYTLVLVVHDDDLFFYNLDRDGKALDGYNSCPQYFEKRRLPDARIEEQRHTPEAFKPLLPAGCSLEDLRSLLNRGWWTAYDTGDLDENGVPIRANDGFLFEGERMTAFGTLLQLHGDKGEYPFAAWGESAKIRWHELIAVRYRKNT